jgi:hypothetical protein
MIKKIKKYSTYIKSIRAINESEESDVSGIEGDIKSMIEKTIKNIGGEFSLFVDSFKQNPYDVKIEGLINDSDVYDFYLKWRNDIDEILNNINFFDEAPSESGSFGLYDFIIKGTERAVIEIVKDF